MAVILMLSAWAIGQALSRDDHATLETHSKTAGSPDPIKNRALLDTPPPMGGGRNLSITTGNIHVIFRAECDIHTSLTVRLSRRGDDWTDSKNVQQPLHPLHWNNLPSGTYQLETSARGWESIQRTIDVDTTAPGQTITLELQPHGIVEGHVTDYTTGEPISRYEVHLTLRSHRPEGRESTESRGPLVIEQDTGFYCYAGIPDTLFGNHSVDDVRLEFHADTYADFQSPWFSVPGGSEERVVDAILVPSDIAFGSVSGHVIDAATGAGVTDCQIGLVESDWIEHNVPHIWNGFLMGVPWASQGARPEEKDGTLSTTEGGYEVSSKLSGLYRLLAFKNGYAIGISDAIQLSPGTSLNSWDVLLDRGGVIRGTIQASMRKQSEFAFTNVRVIHIDPHWERWAPIEGNAFTVSGLDDGDYRICVMGRANSAEPTSNDRMLQIASKPVTLRNGGDEVIVISIDMPGSGSTLAGEIQATEDDSIREWMVGALRIGQDSVPLGAAVVNSSGFFEFSNIPSGDIAVFAVGSNHIDQPSHLAFEFGRCVSDGASSLTPIHMSIQATSVVGGPELSQTFEGGDSVSVHVLECKPTWAVPVIEGTRIFPGEDGTFFVQGLPPGRYVWLAPSGKHSTPIIIKDGGEGTIIPRWE